MKIVEGLKRLQTIERKIYTNNKNITKYSSIINCERPIFNSVEEQKQKVKLLINENTLLCEEYLILKDKIDYTNNTIKIEINNELRTINQFLNLKRKIGKLLISTYESLNESYSENRFCNFRGNNIRIERMYDESYKIENLDYWNDILEQIDGKLEVYNATTDILNIGE